MEGMRRLGSNKMGPDGGLKPKIRFSIDLGGIPPMQEWTRTYTIMYEKLEAAGSAMQDRLWAGKYVQPGSKKRP